MKPTKLLKFTVIILAALQLIGTIVLATNIETVQAADSIQPLNFTAQVPITGSFLDGGAVPVGSYNDKTGKMTSDLLGKYIQAIYNYGLAVGGILATIVLMGGGLLWLTSGGESSKIEKAKDLIFGSITGLAILFCSWIILNTVNPDLLKLKPIEMQVIAKQIWGSCCEYSDYTAKDLVSQKECESNNGKFFAKGHTITNKTTKKAYCADTGCCRCSIGGSWQTLWFNDSGCVDEKNGGGKVLPDVCELACSTAGEASGGLPSEMKYVWGQVCNSSGSCAWNDGSNDGWSGAGGSW